MITLDKALRALGQLAALAADHPSMDGDVADYAAQVRQYIHRPNPDSRDFSALMEDADRYRFVRTHIAPIKMLDLTGYPHARIPPEVRALSSHPACIDHMVDTARNASPVAETEEADITELVELPHVLAWADGILGDMGTEHASKITDEEGAVAQAVWAAHQQDPDPDGFKALVAKIEKEAAIEVLKDVLCEAATIGGFYAIPESAVRSMLRKLKGEKS